MATQPEMRDSHADYAAVPLVRMIYTRITIYYTSYYFYKSFLRFSLHFKKAPLYGSRTFPVIIILVESC